MKLTDELKEKITDDWARLLPGLGVYKPMRLLRRTGPLLSGICLDGDSSNEAYRPTFHVHCLAQSFPGVSLTLAQYPLTNKTHAPQTIRAVFHDERYAEACDRLQRHASLPLTGPLSLSQVIAAYRQYMKTPLGKLYSESLYEDVIAILIWCGQLDQAATLVAELLGYIRSGLARANPESALDIASSVQRCESWIDNPSSLNAIVEREVIKLEADHLPIAALTCD